MGRNNEKDGEGKEPELVLVPYLFGQQETDAAAEQQPGREPAMMPAEPMPERESADGEGQPDHSVFEKGVMDDIDTQYRQAGKYQGKEGAMDSAQYGGGNPQGVIIDLSEHHKEGKARDKTQHCCKKIVISEGGGARAMGV
jgi:hypothetical protein